MKNFILQPYLSDNKVRIYPLASPGTNTTIDIGADGGTNVNSVLVHKNKIFVGVAQGVFIYDFADVFPIRTAKLPVIVNSKDVTGMAINPDNDDLYFALYGTVGVAPETGIYFCTAASNYTVSAQFCSINDPSVAQICANLAFKDGNLWMTTFDSGGSYLICYRNLNKGTFHKIVNNGKTYTATDKDGVTKLVNLLSEPEGITFDSSGNLWLANNNDDYHLNDYLIDGTLVKFPQSTIAAILKKLPDGSDIILNKSDLYIFNILGGMLGGIGFDGNTLYINDQGTNSGNNYASSGVVWKWDITTAFNSINLTPSGVHTTYPGNGSFALSDLVDLYIEDTSYITGLVDTGVEKDTLPQNFWESEAIWMRLADDNGTANQVIRGNTPCWIYVNIKNRGLGQSRGTEFAKLYWAKGGLALGWPAPWNNGDKYGAEISTESLPVIPGGLDYIAKFSFTTLNPLDYKAEFGATNNDHHFCLLARIETAGASENFGMTFPEVIGSNAENVLNNNNIAQRNIVIDDAVTGGPVKGGKIVPFHGTIAANYGKKSIVTRISFCIFNQRGEKVKAKKGELELKFQAHALKKLLKSGFNTDNFMPMRSPIDDHITGEIFGVRDAEIGMSGLKLEPGELLPFSFFYNSEHTGGYIIKVIQYAHSHNKEIIIGGQTFIYGKVRLKHIKK